MIEAWLPVVGFEENYAVSDAGRVRNVLSGRVLRGVRHPDGYIRHQLSRWDGERRWIMAHVLVLTAFVCPRPPGLEALHGDGVHDNNALSNLRWGTHSENIQDSIRHGTHVSHPGSKNGRAILTEADLPSIRERLRRGERQIDVANSYGVSRSTINAISTGRNWS